jgi:hypothetical protein
MGLRSIGLPELVVIMVVGLIIIIWPYWKIFTKAGYSGALGILMVVPLINFIMVFYFAFAEWPVLKELRALRQRVPPPLQQS